MAVLPVIALVVWILSLSEVVIVFLCAGTVAKTLYQPSQYDTFFVEQLQLLAEIYSSLMRVSFGAPYMLALQTTASAVAACNNRITQTLGRRFGWVPYSTMIIWLFESSTELLVQGLKSGAERLQLQFDLRQPMHMGIFGDCDPPNFASTTNGREHKKTFSVPNSQMALISISVLLPGTFMVVAAISFLVDSPVTLLHVPIFIGLQLKLLMALLTQTARACYFVVCFDPRFPIHFSLTQTNYANIAERCRQIIEKARQEAKEDEEEADDHEETDSDNVQATGNSELTRTELKL